MDIRSLVGERALVVVGLGKSPVEVLVMEVSPGGGWVKLRNLEGNRYWVQVASFALVEKLITPTSEPQPEAKASPKNSLTFEDAIRIARGCVDYGGGYLNDQERSIFHHGIQTVANALDAALLSGGMDSQASVLNGIGAGLIAKGKSRTP